MAHFFPFFIWVSVLMSLSPGELSLTIQGCVPEGGLQGHLRYGLLFLDLAACNIFVSSVFTFSQL